MNDGKRDDGKLHVESGSTEEGARQSISPRVGAISTGIEQLSRSAIFCGQREALYHHEARGETHGWRQPLDTFNTKVHFDFLH